MKNKQKQPKQRDYNILLSIKGEISLRERKIPNKKYSRKCKHKRRTHE